MQYCMNFKSIDFFPVEYCMLWMYLFYNVFFFLFVFLGAVFGIELAAQFNCQIEKASPTVLKCIEAVEKRGTILFYKTFTYFLIWQRVIVCVSHFLYRTAS